MLGLGSALLGEVRERPVVAILELGSLATCAFLLVATVVALASGPPAGRGGPWLTVVVIGALFVLLWTAIVPMAERVLFE